MTGIAEGRRVPCCARQRRMGPGESSRGRDAARSSPPASRLALRWAGTHIGQAPEIVRSATRWEPVALQAATFCGTMPKTVTSKPAEAADEPRRTATYPKAKLKA